MRKQDTVIKLVRRLADLIAEEARKNPDFGAQLENLLSPPVSVSRKAKALESTMQQTADDLPDIYEERNARGEAEFRIWLRDQPVSTLRAFIRIHDLDAARRTSKWKDPEKLSAHIADQLQSRASRGASFMRGGSVDEVSALRPTRTVDWIPTEVFDKTEYGRLNRQDGAKNFISPMDSYEVPPGGRVVPDPKDGMYGIVVDRNGTVVCKVTLPR